MATDKQQTNVYLTAVARECLEKLAEHDGGSQSAVVEKLLRREARKEKLNVKGL